MNKAFATAACLQGFRCGMLAVLLVALLSQGTKAFAGDCIESNMPEVIHELSSNILDGNYGDFFDNLSKPTIVGGQLDYSADDISLLTSAFPNGFSDCFVMLDRSQNPSHQQVLIAFFGKGFGLFLYLEAFRPNDTWEIWDYRLSTSFEEVRALLN
jgi:hypothetical protein